MSPWPSTVLGLVLCMGQMIHTQEGVQPKPSIRAEPGPVIPRGQPVTFVCRGPAGARLFRLLKDGRLVSSYQKSVSQDDSQGTETRFLMRAVNEHDAGSYHCLYKQGSHWSERSEPLQLQVTEEDVSTRPSGALPKPSLRAEPGPVIHRGQPVTFVCRGPAGARLFRLDKDERRVPPYQRSVSQDGRQGTEARFQISTVNDDTAGRYSCLYLQGSHWSERSEPLQLQMTEEDVSTQPPGALPKPSLRAEPGPVIHRGQPVTFVCRGPAGARLFRLDKDERRVPPYQRSVSQDGRQGTEARFQISAVNDDTAGRYSCLYLQGSHWSERSEDLQLQVTEEEVSTQPSGALPKPSLRAEPGPVIYRGQPVTFVCQGPAGARLFRLEMDKRQTVSDQKSVPQDGFQGKEARFLIGAVNNDTAGRYSCLYNQGSRWSERSEPLQLQMTEEDVSTQPSGPASRDYKMENSIRLGLAGVVLLILVAILVEAGLSQCRVPQRPPE